MEEQEEHELVERIGKGDLILTTVEQVAELFGQLPEALAEWTPFGWFTVPIESTYHVIKAMDTQERGAGYRGLAYGMMYGALGMGTPSHTVQLSESGEEERQLSQDAWNKGAAEGASAMADVVNRNHLISRIAADGHDPHRTLNEIFQELCWGSGDDGGAGLAAVYDNLPWPGPE